MIRSVAEPLPEPNALRRYELLSENTRDIVLFVRPDGKILEANRAAANAYGYTRGELLSLYIHDLRADETRADVDGQMAAARANGGMTFETVHRRKDGTTFPVEVSSTPSEIGGVLLSLVRDISVRKRAETTGALLREIDLRLLHREPQSVILQTICDRLAGLFGYSLVWIAMKQPEGRITILAHAGKAAGFLEGLEVRWDETPEGGGATGTAIRTGQYQLLPVSDPKWAPFRSRAGAHGIQSSLSLPLVAEGETLGALSLYSTRIDEFDRAIALELTRFANQVALSLLAARDQERIRLQAAALEAWATILAGETWRGELCNRRQDGSLYVEEITITPVRDAAGEVTHFTAVRHGGRN